MDAPFPIFGVRHLSPGAAHHLLAFLEETNPDAVLIEGPSDASALMASLAAEGVHPPVALLAYTGEPPIETVMYPLAGYSPEFQAIRWAVERGRILRFIDLPSGMLLSLRRARVKASREKTGQASGQGRAEAACGVRPGQPAISGQDKVRPAPEEIFHLFHNALFEEVARRAGETDFESYWERNFEHNLHSGSMRALLSLQSTQMREMAINREIMEAPGDFACNLVREAYMRREIDRIAGQGVKPEKTAVIVGAYHIQGLDPALPPMNNEDLAKMPRISTHITLMPYSYHRLSSRSGYGAGNKAPHYFELMWQSMRRNRLGDLPALYLASVARAMRKMGHNVSSACVIEGVRLAGALASISSGNRPVLRDLHDAAVTCFGEGDLCMVAEALTLADIGTAIGSLPAGASQTPVQEDMNRELRRLKLGAYKTGLPREISLDLRENFKVKSAEAAFLDLNRSIFLHRLSILGVRFAEKRPMAQENATWAEKWLLQWTPEAEIEIVEANLKGETIALAAAYELCEALDRCEDTGMAADIIRQACECGLNHIFDNALEALQRLLVDTVSFKEAARAARELSLLIHYGDIRRFDPDPLRPVLQRIFLRASLLLQNSGYCNDKSAAEVAEAMQMMERISQEQFDLVDTPTWQKELNCLARRDDLNARLSGTAFALLLEHNLVDEEDCAKEVSRRLSPGVPADRGAGWFEGLSGRNRYALLSRAFLWKQLDLYVQSLDNREFMRAVVFLRRALGSFEPAQKNSLAELLGEFWGMSSEQTAERLHAGLTEQEEEKLNELNEFDFDI